MSRTILTKRLPVSPNKPPPAPKKLPLKGQPAPIDVNLLVQGNYIERQEHEETLNRKPRSASIARVTKLNELTNLDKGRPRTAHVDKHIMETLKTASVNDSYYDKFERLDRDYVDGDTAYKEKGGRIKSAKPRSRTPGPPRDRKRSKSASSSRRKKDTFFDVAMSFDNETKLNTKRNSETNIAKGLQGMKSNLKPRPESAVERSRRSRSGRRRRERSPSRGRGRSQCSDSKSERSTGSATSSWCSDRTSRSEIPQPSRIRTRSSRSKTRRRIQNVEPPTISTIKQLGRDKNTENSRPVSAKHAQKTSNLTSFRYLSNANASRNLERELALLTQVLDKNEPRARTKPSSRKQKAKKDAAIDAVMKANETENTLRQMREIDKLMYHERRYVTSTLPKLKMIVAPSATPLARLVRQSSAKMLIGNTLEHKRNVEAIHS